MARTYILLKKCNILVVFFFRIQNARMNGEIPSVPITTLAGIASLTDRKQICYQKLYLEV